MADSPTIPSSAVQMMMKSRILTGTTFFQAAMAGIPFAAVLAVTL